MARYHWHILTLLAGLAFAATGQYAKSISAPLTSNQYSDRVVISAPVQLLMYAGDRFLAANLENIRLMATAPVSSDINTTLYLSRAHILVSELNPCHEDNYYVGNAQLSWGGAEQGGTRLLERATECRQWDWYPPYFNGINQYFFQRNTEKAKQSLYIAAERSLENAAALKKAAIMIASAQFKDDRVALNYLMQQQSQAKDAKLKRMLGLRVSRLEGLIALREAQQRFEEKHDQSLKSPQQLISSGELEKFPIDPMGIGYTYKDGFFQLRKLKIPDMED